MQQHVCLVCKKPIDGSISVEVKGGFVHPGECLRYVESLPLTESADEESLNEVQIL